MALRLPVTIATLLMLVGDDILSNNEEETPGGSAVRRSPHPGIREAHYPGPPDRLFPLSLFNGPGKWIRRSKAEDL